MRIFFILSILLVSDGLASTNTVRQKRDMLAVRNFICNLLGLNYNPPIRRFILRRPSNGNNYRVIDNDIYVRTVPDYTLSPMKLRSYQKSEPVYQVHSYRNENDYSKPLKSQNKRKPILVEKLSKARDDDLSNIVNVKKVLPQRPLYIQDRLKELNNVPTVYVPVTKDKIVQPIVQSSYNTVLLPPGAGEVHVSKYPLIRTSFKDPAVIGEKLNSSKTLLPSLSPFSELVGLRTMKPAIQTPEENEKTKLKINTPETPKKAVKFSEPVPLKYSYKNVYHMQPSKNTAIKFDNTISTTEADRETKSLPSKSNNSDFFFLPPIKKNDPLLSANKVKTYEGNNQDNELSKNKPTDAIDEPYTNKQDDMSKAKNSLEQRGDIPALFLQ